MSTSQAIASKADVVVPGSLGDPDVRLLRFELTEGLSQPFELRLDLASKKGTLDTGKLLGQSISVKLTLPSGTERHLNGRVAEAGLAGSLRGQHFQYRVVLRPGLWFLTHTRKSRIFPDKTALEAVQQVLGESYASAVGVKLDVRTRTTYTKRPYCVQYHESDFDFVSRLLEEEGIYYYFKHESGSHSMVLCDGPTAHDALLSSARMAYRPGASQASTDEECVLAWHHTDIAGPSAFTVRSFDFERPSKKLEATGKPSTAPGPSNLAVHVFPEGYLFEGAVEDKQGSTKKSADDQATHFAKVMAERRDAQARQIDGATDALAMACGHTFDVSQLPNDSQNGKYLVTRTVIEYTQGLPEASGSADSAYSCMFSALSHSVPYRPPAATPRPVVHGPHTAIVIGSGEIDTDMYGRVKVRFPWGQDTVLNSCWARVSYPWASKNFGALALPRVGDEVVVSFVDGDPDHPLITGRVYNAENLPPYELPAHKTISGIRTRSSEGGAADNFNELRFEDKKGDEHVWLQAEKIFHRKVKLDAFDKVGQDQHVDIVRDRLEKLGRDWHVEVGQHLTQKVVGDVQVDIGKDTLANIGAHLKLNVANDIATKVGGSVELNAASKLQINTGADTALTSEAKVDIDMASDGKFTSGTKLELNAGQAMALEAGQTLDLKGGMKIVAEGGMSISLKAGAMVVIDGGTQITLKAGPSTVTLGPAGVTIDGPLVKINSGGGGGNANAAKAATKAAKAKKAEPDKPKAPTKPTEQKDPIA